MKREVCSCRLISGIPSQVCTHLYDVYMKKKIQSFGILSTELLDACEYYVSRTKRRVSFEWALIQGQTDTEATAHELGALLQGYYNRYSSILNVYGYELLVSL